MSKRDLKPISSYTVSALQGVWRAKKAGANKGPGEFWRDVELNTIGPTRQSTTMCAPGSSGVQVVTQDRLGADVAHVRCIGVGATGPQQAEGSTTRHKAKGSSRPEFDGPGLIPATDHCPTLPKGVTAQRIATSFRSAVETLNRGASEADGGATSDATGHGGGTPRGLARNL